MSTHRIHANREPVNHRQNHPRSNAGWQVPARQARQVKQVPSPSSVGPKPTGNSVAFYLIFLALSAALAMGGLW